MTYVLSAVHITSPEAVNIAIKQMIQKGTSHVTGTLEVSLELFNPLLLHLSPFLSQSAIANSNGFYALSSLFCSPS